MACEGFERKQEQHLLRSVNAQLYRCGREEDNRIGTVRAGGNMQREKLCKGLRRAGAAGWQGSARFKA